MKRFFTTIFLSIFITKIFSLELNFQIDVESDIKNKNYYYEYTKNKELYIEKIINLGEEIEIKQINFQILSFMDKVFLEKGDNPEISTGDYKTNLKESPLSHFQYKIANSGKNKILILQIFPYLKNLADKKSIKNVNINVIYEKNKSSILNSYYDFIYPDKKDKKIKIINQNNIDFLIITTEKYINLFNNFIHIFRALGFNTQIVSVESILQEISGVDPSQTIRNYIKKIYYENGLRFLLLGGDTEIIPSRNVISDIYYYLGVYPSDLYYGDVDGEWNKDNDEIIGEIEDIEDGFLDIAITRLPFSNENELINIFKKFADYIFNFDQTKIKNFLHAGASLYSNLSDGSGQLMTNDLLSLKESYTYNNFTMFSPVVDTFHQIYTINVFTKILNEKTLLSGSFFGKLNRKSLYVKSSFNYADFNHDSKNKVIVLSDDGRVIIFNDKLEDITPFKLQTKPYQESTPAIGDIKGNGYFDIVIPGGYFSSDTSGYLILNPFNDKKILPIINYGVLTSSPVLEDIDFDLCYEIFLGTSSGFYILDKNLNKKWSLNIKNVCGIFVSKDRNLIFINNFYGNLYGVDFLRKIKGRQKSFL